MKANAKNSVLNLRLLWLDSNESGMNVVYSHLIVRYTVVDNFIIGKNQGLRE